MTDPVAFPQIERLVKVCSVTRIGKKNCEDYIKDAGCSVLFFVGDPARYPEALDIAVILPEIAKAFPGRFRIALVEEDAEKTLQARFGFNVWPALVFLRDGGYVGAMTGVSNWEEFLREAEALMMAPISSPPGIGLPVMAESSGCH